MKKFEYKVLKTAYWFLLNKEGSDGWELVQTFENVRGEDETIFKREIPTLSLYEIDEIIKHLEIEYNDDSKDESELVRLKNQITKYKKLRNETLLKLMKV